MFCATRVDFNELCSVVGSGGMRFMAWIVLVINAKVPVRGIGSTCGGLRLGDNSSLQVAINPQYIRAFAVYRAVM